MGWLRSRQNLDDERVLIGVTAGVLWLVGAVAAGLAQLLPGAPGTDWWLFVTLGGAVGLYGFASIVGWIDWTKVSVNRHALASATLMPLLGVALWATGGQSSYLQPILVLPLLHVAYFFAPRVSYALVAELIFVYASPLAYEDQVRAAFPARVLTFAVAALMLTLILRALKNRLLAAEAHQRTMAERDPLTGLVNRRGFDDVLHRSVAARGEGDHGRRAADDLPGFALLLFDLDRFKHVNDTQGHPAGDRVLRAVAANCAAIVREGDTLARIGGDEFAVIAPGAGANGARRLAAELSDAASRAGIECTVAWAVHPSDGTDGETLLREADRRLYEGKRAAVVSWQ